MKPITYFFPIEEVNNCFQVINQGVDKFQICKNTTGSSETTFAIMYFMERNKKENQSQIQSPHKHIINLVEKEIRLHGTPMRNINELYIIV